MRAVIEQGCDLDLDILPIVAREVPELPRPLRNWGAQWLVREILAARDQRLAGTLSGRGNPGTVRATEPPHGAAHEFHRVTTWRYRGSRPGSPAPRQTTQRRCPRRPLTGN